MIGISIAESAIEFMNLIDIWRILYGILYYFGNMGGNFNQFVLELKWNSTCFEKKGKRLRDVNT